MSVIIKGGASQNLADVNAYGHMKIVGETSASARPENVGSFRFFSENDTGAATGTADLTSPETDQDYRLRISKDTILDMETFNYVAQNTGKHTYVNTTLTALWSTSGFISNSSSIQTASTGLTFGTYAEYPMLGSTQLYLEVEGGFVSQPVSNCIIDFGLFRRNITATPYAPTDGVFFRQTSGGLFGVISYNGSEVTTNTFNFTYVSNQKYQFIISVHQRMTEFWINDVLYGSIPTPDANGQPFMSSTLPISFRQAHVGTTSGVQQFIWNSYTLSVAGTDIPRTMGEFGNAVFGSYQGLSGGTMGSLSSYINSTNPTPATPSNTSLVSNLPNALGGQAWVTSSIAANTDGILMSVQVPTGTTGSMGKRLKVTGVKMSAYVQTVLAGGPMVTTFALAYGHTTQTLAGNDSATAKARRIILLPELTQFVTSNQAVSTVISQPGGCVSNFSEPIYVNGGEFIALTMKNIGSVYTTGVIAYNIQYVYSWE